jgi:uncharacterized protein YdbL (DUF1318 family)
MLRLDQLATLLLVWGITATCAQITVNVYFPAAEIRDAAAHIEREVRQEEATPATPSPQPGVPPGKPPRSQLRPQTRQVRLGLSLPMAAAQGININITTPAIRQLIAARKQRYPHLVPLFDRGALGENNRGLVEIRSLEGLSLQDKAQAQALSQQENNNRQQLYQALAEANNIPRDKMAEIATIFAGVNRQEAHAGWWIQEDNGEWKKK